MQLSPESDGGIHSDAGADVPLPGMGLPAVDLLRAGVTAPEPERPSLRSVSGFSFFWYLAVVAGWILLGKALVVVLGSDLSVGGAPLAMTGSLIVLLELFPLVQGRGHDPQGVVMSTAFVCAMLFFWGIWPAIVVVSIAALASDLNVGKSWWKVAFNLGQYNLSVTAGWLVMVAVGQHPSLSHPLHQLNGSDLPWIVAVWLAYFFTNLVLVSGVLAWRDSFLGVFLDDFWHYTAMTFAVIALSPLVVVTAQRTWVLLPLLLIPLLLVYRTAQLSLEKEHQAGHDPLTDLPNRKSLLSRLNEELSRSRKDGNPFGLLLLDLDHFKEINDTLGHHVGDQVLVYFSGRLLAAVRDTDVVARLGGDEFAVIVPSADAQTVFSVAERIRESLAEPVCLEGVLFEIEASIGIAMHPTHGRHADDLLRLADVAMYNAKENRTGIAAYAASRDRNSTDRLGLLGELRHALDNDMLCLHYQPKVSMHDASLMGVEALIRWEHPSRGFIPPDEFIPLAERSGIMPDITARVVNLALGQVAEWRAAGMEVPVAINVSVTDVSSGRLAGTVAEALRAHRLPARLLRLEITERVVAHEVDEVNELLQRLTDLGVTLSLDDFGTGYSSLFRLQSLPVHEIKIDRAFVSRLSESSQGSGIVQAVIDLAHALRVPAIAEGVETETEWRTLQVLGCDGGQGWHIAAAMTAADMTAWIRRQQLTSTTGPGTAGSAAGTIASAVATRNGRASA